MTEPVKQAVARISSHIEFGPPVISAVDDVIEQNAGSLRHIHRLQNCKIRAVLHAPGGVLWRKREVGDQGVAWICRIDFPRRDSLDLFVGTDRSKRLAAVSGRT